MNSRSMRWEERTKGMMHIAVITPWLKHGAGQRITVRPTDDLKRVLVRVSVRIAAPLNADVALHHIQSGSRIQNVDQLRELGLGPYRAEVVTNELKTVVNLEGKKVTTVALGCDRCNTTDQSAAEQDLGTFTPSATRLGLAVLGNIDGQVYGNFWTQMRRVLAADAGNLRLDKFKTWHSIRRIPLYACRGWQDDGIECIKDLFVAPNRTFHARELVGAIRESRRGHTRGTWAKCALNMSVDVSENKSGDKMVQVSTSTTQLAFACDLRDMLRYGIDVRQRRLIIEFGAGYGGLAAFLAGAGFKGRYIVYDFPELAPVQRYIMEERGMDFRLVHSAEDLSTEVKASATPQQGCLFVAMWSLSEMPIKHRTAIVAAVSRCEQFIIKFQDHFMNLDNVHFFGKGGPFREMVERHGEMEWRNHWAFSLVVGHRKPRAQLAAGGEAAVAHSTRASGLC